MIDLMSVGEKISTLSVGRSIQGGTVYDTTGNVWGEFKTHEEALAAVHAYRAGFERGREIGRREGASDVRWKIRSALEIT